MRPRRPPPLDDHHDAAADHDDAAADHHGSRDDDDGLATTTTAAPTTTLPPPVQPLTGLPLDDPALLNRVALIVKVSNDPGARPQTGLNDADIVFEAWGAGPTRFATVWHSRDPDFVGPIRSCREQDVNLLGEFNRAVFACSGGNPGNIALLRDSDMLLITEGKGPGWELDPKRSRPHKTHANTALLRSNAGPDRTGPTQQYHYRAVGEAATAGEPMTGFDLQIQQVFVQWRYDPDTATYLRSQEGKPHMLTDGNQVTTENVVVAWLDYNPSHTDGRSPDGRAPAPSRRGLHRWPADHRHVDAHRPPRPVRVQGRQRGAGPAHPRPHVHRTAEQREGLVPRQRRVHPRRLTGHGTSCRQR